MFFSRRPYSNLSSVPSPWLITSNTAALAVILCSWSQRRELPFYPVVKSQIDDALCGKRWDVQGRFKPGHSSIDLHFTLRLLSEKITGFHKLFTAHFIDYWQTSDSVYRTTWGIWSGVLERVVLLTKELWKGLESCVWDGSMDFYSLLYYIYLHIHAQRETFIKVN